MAKVEAITTMAVTKVTLSEASDRDEALCITRAVGFTSESGRTTLTMALAFSSKVCIMKISFAVCFHPEINVHSKRKPL